MPRKKFVTELIDPDLLYNFLKRKGAATTSEIKTEFNTTSFWVRKSLWELGREEDMNLCVMSQKDKGTATVYWFEWPAKQKGRPNPIEMRYQAHQRELSERLARKVKARKEAEVEDLEELQ